MQTDITVHVVLDGSEGVDFLANLFSLTGGSPITQVEQPPLAFVPPAEEKPKRSSRAAVKKEEPKPAEVQQAEPEAPLDAVKETPESNVDLAPLTKSDLKRAAAQYFERHGASQTAKDKAKALIKTHGGFEKVDDCPVETYPAIFSALQEVANAA